MVSVVIIPDVYHRIGNAMVIWIVMIRWMKNTVMNVEMINSIVVMVFVLIEATFVMANLIVPMVVTNDNAVCVIIINRFSLFPFFYFSFLLFSLIFFLLSKSIYFLLRKCSPSKRFDGFKRPGKVTGLESHSW